MSKPDFEKMAKRALAETPELWLTPCFLPDVAFNAIVREMAVMAKSIFNDGLSRAGDIAHNHGWYSMAYVEDEPPPDVVTHNYACWAIRDAIRAEREKS